MAKFQWRNREKVLGTCIVAFPTMFAEEFLLRVVKTRACLVKSSLTIPDNNIPQDHLMAWMICFGQSNVNLRHIDG